MRISKLFLFISVLIAIIIIGVIIFFLSGDEENVEIILTEPSAQINSFGGLINEIDNNIIGEEFTAPNQNNGELGVDDITGVFGRGVEDFQLLTKLFSNQVAGYRIENEKVQVVERGVGNRYDITVFPYNIEKISSGELNKVVEAHIFENGKTLLMYESPSDETFIRSGFVNFKSAVGEQIQLFENNIRATTDGKNKIFFLRDSGETVSGVVVDVDNPGDTKVVWSSGVKNWIPRWGGGRYITLSSPISVNSRGFVYSIDSEDTEDVARILGGKTANGAFFDFTSGLLVKTEARPNSNTISTSIIKLYEKEGINIPTTLPEKCDGVNGVFVCAAPKILPSTTLSGHTSSYPDSWYQGDLLLDDTIILIDTNNGKKEILLDSSHPTIQALSNNTVFDIVDPKISEDGNLFYFVNREDSSLWVLRL